MSDVSTLDLAAPHRSRPVTGRRFLLIYNPMAGLRRRGRLSRTVETLHDLGCAVTLAETTCAGHAAELAAQARPDEVDAVVAAGGDGTINEVVNGLCQRAERGEGPPLPLGIVPLGTANVLALELGLPWRGAQIGRVLANAPTRMVHIGRCLPDNGLPRLFAQMLGAGMDARVVASIRPHMKRQIGKAAYMVEGMREILSNPRVGYAVEIERPDGGRERHEVASAVLAKGHFYGGTYVLAPQARLEDPGFQVCLFLRGGRLTAFAYAAGMVLGGLDRLPAYKVVPAVRVRVTALPGGPAGEPVQADGDVLATVPFTADIAPYTLPVLG